jgi:hypothetical protein
MSRNVGAVTGLLVLVGFLMPRPYVADFAAGDVCTITSSQVTCATGGVDPCTLQKVICNGGTVENSTFCENNTGNPACQADSNCLQTSKHATRQMDCTAPGSGGTGIQPG